DQTDERRAPAGFLLDLLALRRGPLVVPEQGRPDDLAFPVEEDGAVHLATQAESGYVLRPELTRAQDLLHRLDRRVPPEVRMLLGPPRRGMVAGILRRRRRQDRPPLVDGQRLRPGCPDVDPQRDTHRLTSQPSPHRRSRGETPSGSLRASDTNISTGTVLKVNIS